MKERKKPIDYALPLRHFVGIVFFFVIAVTCIQVISRYVFNRSLIWSEESVRFMVVWMCMLGCAVSNFDDDHMMINIIVERFPRPMQFTVYTVRQILIIGFCVACSYASIPLIKAAGTNRLGAIPVPAYTWRLAGTVGLAVQALMTLLRWFYDYDRFRRGEFCLKDADTEVAENAGKTEIRESANKGGEAK
jgi:TRAP-type C4-dicarboxylate transport system permease small subunit